MSLVETKAPDVADTVRNLLSGTLPFDVGECGGTWEWGCPNCGAGADALRVKAYQPGYFDVYVQENGLVHPDGCIDTGDWFDFQPYCSECDNEVDVAVKVPIVK